MATHTDRSAPPRRHRRATAAVWRRAALGLSACKEPAPSGASAIRALPAVSMDQGLATFRAVCLGGNPAPTDSSLIFERDALPDGRPLYTTGISNGANARTYLIGSVQ